MQYSIRCRLSGDTPYDHDPDVLGLNGWWWELWDDDETCIARSAVDYDTGHECITSVRVMQQLIPAKINSDDITRWGSDLSLDTRQRFEQTRAELLEGEPTNIPVRTANPRKLHLR
jgi:hypothetical protein